MTFKQPIDGSGRRWHHYFLEELRELYRSEKHWLIVLPEVARKMPASEVDQAVVQHLEQIVAKVNQLERVFQSVAADNQEESRAIKPILREAGTVLIAVTRSTVAVRKQAAVRSAVSRELVEKLPVWLEN